MRLGLGRLRHPPDVFWRMTVPELAAAARALAGQTAETLDRGALAALLARFPDHPSEDRS